MAKSGKKARPAARYTVKAALLRLGSDTIDGRSRLAKAMDDLREDLTASLGGEENLSKQQELLIATVAKSWLLLESLDRFILAMDCPVNRKRRSAYPIILERAKLADSLLRQLQALGLRRLPRPLPSLPQTIVRPHEWEEQEEEAGGDSPVDEPPAKDAKVSEGIHEKPE